MSVLQDMRVLVVENDELNAALLQLQLETAGALVIGIAGTVADALSLLEMHEPDVVLLDYWLAPNQDSTPIAESLKVRSIPYLLVTGADRSQLPPLFASGPALSKPYTGRELVQALSEAAALPLS